MVNRQFVVALSPEKIDAALVAGGRVRTRARIPLDPKLWRTYWSGGLVGLDGPLARAAQRVGARGKTRSIVVVDTPSGFNEVGTFPAIGETATHAATARFHERQEAELHAIRAHLLGESYQATEPRSLVLTIAERKSVLNELFALFQRAGLSLATVVPTRAAAIAAALDIADARTPQQGRAGVCLIGESASALVYRTEAGLQLVRAIDIGTNNLAEAYARASRRDGKPDPDREPDPNDMLFTSGVPAKTNKFEGELDVTDVGPLLSPVLQRLTIEIKQSLKYGIEPGQRPDAIELAGIGAAIPGLAEALTTTLEVDVITRDPVPGAPESFAPASIAHAVANNQSNAPALEPGAARSQSETTRLRHATLAAAGLGILLLGGEYTMIARESEETRRASRQLTPLANQLDAYEADRQQVTSAIHRIASAVRVAELQTGERADWEASLLALEDILGPDGLLREIRGDDEPGNVTIRIEGETRADQDPAQHLAAIVDRIRTCPLIRTFELGGTADAVREGRRVTEFTIVMQLHTFPLHHTEPQIPRVITTAEVSP